MHPNIMWLDTCASTNDEALARLDDRRQDAVATDHQTAGRGRRGRRWQASPGCSLTLTWIARPTFSPEHGAALSLLAAVAVADLLVELGHRPLLKWPNDVLLDGRKVAGVLCEARIEADRLTAAVGIGLNLRTPPGGFPAELEAIALETAEPARRLADRLITALIRVLADLPDKDPLAPIVAAWQRHGPAPGTRLRQAEVTGTYAGLAPSGALRLRSSTEPSRIIEIHAGEVQLVSLQE